MEGRQHEAADVPLRYVILTEDSGIARVVLNRPETLNALSLEVELEILAALRWAEDNDEVKAAIITGAGQKAFSAGADIKGYVDMDLVKSFSYLQQLHEVLWAVENLRKPVIAAINGLCLGGGFELALACTLRFAGDSAAMGLPEINVGCIPGNGGLQRLGRLVGKGRAMWYGLTGAHMSAAEALNMGVVNGVFPADTLLEDVERLVREQLLPKAPIAVWAVRKSLNIGMELDLKSACEGDLQIESICFATRDFHEGVTAFVDKRRPLFCGE